MSLRQEDLVVRETRPQKTVDQFDERVCGLCWSALRAVAAPVSLRISLLLISSSVSWVPALRISSTSVSNTAKSRSSAASVLNLIAEKSKPRSMMSVSVEMAVTHYRT